MVRAASRGWVLVALLVCGLLVLPAVSMTASACSLAPIEFDEAAWVDTDRFVTTFGFGVVVFDLSDGIEMSEWGGGFFHRLAGDPLGDRVALRVQEGLGGDCSGDLYLDLWDQQEGQRVERIPGSYGPLAGSVSGLLAGHGDLLEVSVFPWETLSEPRTVRTGLPEDVFDNMHRYAVAYPDDGSVLVALPEDPPTLYWVPLDSEDRAVWQVDVAGDAFEMTPGLAFEPMGSRLAAVFTVEGRDRVVLFDLEDPSQGFRGLMNAESPQEQWREGRSLAWTQEGIVVVGGDRVRHVDEEGGLREVVLGSGTARNVVASPYGSSWVVLVEDWEEGHQVIRYIGEGVVTSQWRYADEGWELVHPSQWSHLSHAQQDDPAWDAAGPVEGGPAGKPTYLPAPGAFAVLVVLIGAVCALHGRRGP